MNEVDCLLGHKFETLTLEEKLEVKRLGAHQPWDIVLTQNAGKSSFGFNVEWFTSKKWLTANKQKRCSSVFAVFYLVRGSLIQDGLQ